MIMGYAGKFISTGQDCPECLFEKTKKISRMILLPGGLVISMV
jgi:hypothetical protein